MAADGVKTETKSSDPTLSWTTDACVAFFAELLPLEVKDRDSILDAIRAKGITGTDLLGQFGDQDLKDAGIKAFGKRKKIVLALDALREAETIKVKPAQNLKDQDCPAPGENGEAVLAMLAPEQVDSSLEQERTCVAASQNVVANVVEALKSKSAAGWAGEVVHDLRLREATRLHESCTLPLYSVVTVGNTGAGKSTLLNSILGETEILPTNGMRACTAVLIEMTYDFDREKSNRDYVGEIEFISKSEWEAEVEDCLSELTTEDGRAILHVHNPGAHNYGSWCKLFAVYGEKFTHSSVATGEVAADGRKVYKGPPIDDLRDKLRLVDALTKSCGSTERVTSNSAAEFRKKIERFTDSANQVAEGSYWPLVKLVRIKSSKWNALRPGVTLVDAPGLNDSNASRNAVVSRYLQEAQAIWITSNITRAVNDKTAKDLLSPDFRRQLLMDGKMNGSVAFVATQTDLLQRSEIVKSLHLPIETSVVECAKARNDFTKERLRSDFFDGIAEMATAAGDESMTRELIEKRFRLPVFTVSSVDFQKHCGLRPQDGQVLWQDPDETEIPRLVKHLQAAAIVRRAIAVKEQAEEVAAFAAGVALFCSGLDEGKKLSKEIRENSKEIFDNVVGPLPLDVKKQLQEFETSLNNLFDCDINPSLAEGAAEGEAEALEKIKNYGKSVTVGGMHWSTYRATIRRFGKFRTDWNEELSAPIFAAVSTRWEKTFCGEVKKRVQMLSAKLQEMLTETMRELNKSLLESGLEKDRVNVLETVVAREAQNKFNMSVNRVLKAVEQQQKSLSRSVGPEIQGAMTPAYRTALHENGQGSHRRRVDIIEGHVSSKKHEMFQTAVEGLFAALRPIAKGMRDSAQEIANEMLESVGANYSCCWEPPDRRSKAAREYLTPKLEKAAEHIKIALYNLVNGIAASAEMDPDIEVVLDPMSAAAAAEAAAKEVAAEVTEAAAPTTRSGRQTRATSGADSPAHEGDGDEGLELVGVVGVMASDLPHPRFLCGEFPVAEQASKYCQQCYCFICDIPARACAEWSDHCSALASNPKCLAERRKRKGAM